MSEDNLMPEEGESTVTLTLDAATLSRDFLRFGVAGIVNPSIPKGPDSTGYTLDIKTADTSGNIIESGFSLNPVFIGGGNFGGGGGGGGGVVKR